MKETAINRTSKIGWTLTVHLLGCLLLVCLLAVPVHSQSKKKRNKKKEEKELKVSDFYPSDSASVLVLPRITFPNINKKKEYYDASKLAEIARFRKNKQWDDFLRALYQYVGNFGINNFIKDIDLVWQLARVAEYKGEIQLTKDLFRVIIKHYRGNLQEALVKYDSLTAFEKDLYVSMDEYYRLVERRSLIDTLHPPQKIMLDMGEGVNSMYDDYGLTIAGQSNDLIFFTSSRNPDTAQALMDIMGVHEKEDIYISHKDEADIWGTAEPFEEMNSPYKEGSPCMSADGKTFVFARCLSPEGMGDCDLYISYKGEDGKWSEPENLGPNVNSYAWDSHPAFSLTEDTLFFASNRRGGFGGSDIYFSIKDAKTGKWGKTFNIGPVINTRDSEVSPYPHPRFDVLYFSSNGQILNFGDFDIYKSYRVDGQWVEPRNVGPLVNSPGSELYFTIDSESKWLFYAKSEDLNGKNLDLKSFPLPMEAKPNNTVRFSGKVVEPVTGEVFRGIVTVIDLDEGVEVAPKYLREDGTFEFELIDKRKYLLVVEGDNFFKIEEMFFMDGDTDIEVEATSVHQTFTFESIDFDRGSSKLKADMENNLHLVIDFMVKNPAFYLKVTGHTDSDGDSIINMKLSQERADVIKDYILDYGGMDAGRVMAIGMGNKQPVVADEKTEQDKKLNRRVEFMLYRPEE